MKDNFQPTVESLEAAYNLAKDSGSPPKFLILIQPNNPTGILYSEETIRLCLDYAYSKKLHIVSDEIYAISVFPG